MSQLTMYSGLVNSPETTITNNVGVADTLIYVLDPARVPTPLPNLMTIGTGTNAETVLVTAINDNALTVERGFQGIAKDWLAGTIIARNFTEYDYNALKENIEDLNTNVGDKTTLNTTDKTDVVGAINEVLDEANYPFKIKSATYTSATDTLTITISSGTGETFNDTTINTITKTTDTTLDITPVTASATYTIYLGNDGVFASSTDGTTSTGSITIGTVSTNADKSVNTIIDKRPLVSGVGKEFIAHKAETVSQKVYVSRDLSLEGVQTITGFNGLPKKIDVYAAVENTAKQCNGFFVQNDQGGRYSIGTNFILGSTAIRIYDNDTSSTSGIIQNVVNGQIEINWVKDGTDGATGTLGVYLVAHYH